MNLLVLFNAKVIIIEVEKWYYLTHPIYIYIYINMAHSFRYFGQSMLPVGTLVVDKANEELISTAAAEGLIRV